LTKYAPGLLDSAQCKKGLDSPEWIIELKDIDLDAFDVFVNWLNKDREDAEEHMDDLGIPLAEFELDHLDIFSMITIKSYVFAASFGIRGLCSTALYGLTLLMREWAKRVASPESTTYSSVGVAFARKQIAYIYNDCEDFPSLRRLVVESFCAARMDKSLTNRELACYPSMFLVELMEEKEGEKVVGRFMDHAQNSERTELERRRVD
jgi:hypothetical protein